MHSRDGVPLHLLRLSCSILTRTDVEISEQATIVSSHIGYFYPVARSGLSAHQTWPDIGDAMRSVLRDSVFTTCCLSRTYGAIDVQHAPDRETEETEPNFVSFSTFCWRSAITLHMQALGGIPFYPSEPSMNAVVGDEGFPCTWQPRGESAGCSIPTYKLRGSSASGRAGLEPNSTLQSGAFVSYNTSPWLAVLALVDQRNGDLLAEVVVP